MPLHHTSITRWRGDRYPGVRRHWLGRFCWRGLANRRPDRLTPAVARNLANCSDMSGPDIERRRCTARKPKGNAEKRRPDEIETRHLTLGLLHRTSMMTTLPCC